MDITWGINTELVSKNGKSFFIDPLDVWENVKINSRMSIKGPTFSDIEYKGEKFFQIPSNNFLIHN